MRRFIAAPVVAAVLTAACSSAPHPDAGPVTDAVAAAPSASSMVDLDALVTAAMIPGESLPDAGAKRPLSWSEGDLGAGWVSFICREPVGTADVGGQARFTRTWSEGNARTVEVTTAAWTRHSGAQMLDRLRTATASCTAPFTQGGQLFTFTPEIELPAYPEVVGFAHCATVRHAPDNSAEKHCYAYLAKGNVLTKVESRAGEPEGRLRDIAAVAAARLREVS